MNYTRLEPTDDYLSFCDYNNERSVLALAVKDEDIFYSLLSSTTPEDFLAPDTHNLFNILQILHSTGVKKFDISVLSKVAEEVGCDSSCGYTFLEAVFNTNIAKDNYSVYLGKLLDDSTKYKLYKKLSSNASYVYGNAKSLQTVSSNDLLSKVQSELLSLSISSNSVSEPRHVGDGLAEYIESIQDRKVELMGISTGYPLLDKAIDGLVPGTLMVIAARKKMGKSTLLTNIAANVAIRDGGSALYVDTEMPFEQWRSRVLAMISGVEERDILHGGFKNDKEVFNKIINAVKLIEDSRLFHFYLPGYTVEKISALYKKYKLKEDIDLGVFDYIKEPDSSSTPQGRKEYQILGDVTTKLKDLSGVLNIPILAAVQLNRNNDIADSDRVARYGDVIAFWGLRDLKVAEENAWDLYEKGHYGLCIKDSRRGGRTGEQGIGYQFFHSKLTIKEVSAQFQIEQRYDEEERIDVGNITGLPEEQYE